MIRFMADTWQDALLRPLAMAAPNGWVYTEIMAPDFRFVFALGLAFVLMVALLVKRPPNGKSIQPVVVALILLFGSFVPWMLTTGNGRYFMPYLLLIGPLCVALIYLLPATRGMKATLVGVILGLQGFAVSQNNPWSPFDSLVSIPWKDTPYFSIEGIPETVHGNETFVTISNLTMSLVAPLFPGSVRWVNLSIFNGADVATNNETYLPVRRMLEQTANLYLFQTAQPRQMVGESNQPTKKAIYAINTYLHPHKLAIKEPVNCKLLKSVSMGSKTFTRTDESAADKARFVANSGFWICPLVYPVEAPKAVDLTPDQLRAKSVIDKMEQICPRNFAPGQTLVGPHEAGYARSYASSDASLIWTRNDELWVQNARALNPERIGTAEEVLKPGFSFDCTKFKGRAGLPWEREI